jgi:hypothetical protein
MIDNLLYCNDGDWVESLTALVETHEGELKIVHWPRILDDKPVIEEVTVEQMSLSISFPSRVPSPGLMAQSTITHSMETIT